MIYDRVSFNSSLLAWSVERPKKQLNVPGLVYAFSKNRFPTAVQKFRNVYTRAWCLPHPLFPQYTLMRWQTKTWPRQPRIIEELRFLCRLSNRKWQLQITREKRAPWMFCTSSLSSIRAIYTLPLWCTVFREMDRLKVIKLMNEAAKFRTCTLFTLSRNSSTGYRIVFGSLAKWD